MFVSSEGNKQMFPEFTVQFRVIKIIIPAVTSQLLSIETQCNFVFSSLMTLSAYCLSTSSWLCRCQHMFGASWSTDLPAEWSHGSSCCVWEQLPLPDRDLKALFLVLCFVFLPPKSCCCDCSPQSAVSQCDSRTNQSVLTSPAVLPSGIFCQGSASWARGIFFFCPYFSFFLLLLFLFSAARTSLAPDAFSPVSPRSYSLKKMFEGSSPLSASAGTEPTDRTEPSEQGLIPDLPRRWDRPFLRRDEEEEEGEEDALFRKLIDLSPFLSTSTSPSLTSVLSQYGGRCRLTCPSERCVTTTSRRQAAFSLR